MDLACIEPNLANLAAQGPIIAAILVSSHPIISPGLLDLDNQSAAEATTTHIRKSR